MEIGALRPPLPGRKACDSIGSQRRLGFRVGDNEI